MCLIACYTRIQVVYHYLHQWPASYITFSIISTQPPAIPLNSRLSGDTGEG